jgi:hypothetical protein
MKCCEYGPKGPYSQHFTFIANYKGHNKLERYIKLGWKDLLDKNSSLSGLLTCDDENEVL